MINEEAVQALRTTLEADGYDLDVKEEGDRVGVTITAGPDACEDCLVPKPLLLSTLHQQLGVPEGSIDLVYPDEK